MKQKQHEYKVRKNRNKKLFSHLLYGMCLVKYNTGKNVRNF